MRHGLGRKLALKGRKEEEVPPTLRASLSLRNNGHWNHDWVLEGEGSGRTWLRTGGGSERTALTGGEMAGRDSRRPASRDEVPGRDGQTARTLCCEFRGFGILCHFSCLLVID